MRMGPKIKENFDIWVTNNLLMRMVIIMIAVLCKLLKQMCKWEVKDNLALAWKTKIDIKANLRFYDKQFEITGYCCIRSK